MAGDQFQGALNDLLNGAGAPPAGAAGQTAAFVGGTPAPGAAAPAGAPAGGKKEDAEQTKLVRNAISARAIKKDSAQGRIRAKFSELAKVCGYTNSADSKFDFAKKTVQEAGTDAYNIFVKMAPPSKADGVIVLYPVGPWRELQKENPDSMDVGAADSAEQAYELSIIQQSSMINWMQKFSAGYLLESEHIFEPCIRKAGKAVISVLKPSDVTPNKKAPGVPALPAIYVDLAGSLAKSDAGVLKNKPKLRIRSNYRTKLITPNNYISKRIYETVPVKAAYTPAEIEQNLRMYFDRYLHRTTKSGKAIQSAFSSLSAEAKANFVAKQGEDGKWGLASTNYFSADASSSAWNSTTVDHWFRKNASGEPEKIPASTIALVKREQPEADKPIGFAKKVLTDPAKAGPNMYTLEAEGRHKAVFAACGGQLSFAILDKFYAESASSSRGSGAGLGAGTSIMGLTPEVLDNIVSSFVNKV